MSLLRQWFGRDPWSDAATDLYHAVVAQSRNPAFYRASLVEDTADGRFDMVLLHVSLVFARLRRPGASGGEDGLAQALFDQMTGHFDVGLRQIGVGDLSVGRRVKKMVQAFYGRLAAYEGALTAGDRAALEEALRRNLYRGREVSSEAVTTMATYMTEQAAHLAMQDDAALRAGRVAFMPLSAAASASELTVDRS